jgi:hypothetical protein
VAEVSKQCGWIFMHISWITSDTIFLYNTDWSPRRAWLSQSASIYHLSHNLELQATGKYKRMYIAFRLLKYYNNFFSNSTLTEVLLTLTEVLPCFSLSCKANASVKLTKTGHGPHSFTLVCICVVCLLFVLLYVLFVCKCVVPLGDNPISVNKYHLLVM